jgi:hypothetical protein
MIVEIDGQQHDVPDDITEEELNQLFPAPAAAPAAPAQPEGWGDYLKRQVMMWPQSMNRMATRAITGIPDLALATGAALRNSKVGQALGAVPTEGVNLGNMWLDATNTPRRGVHPVNDFVEGMGTAALSGGMGSGGMVANAARLAGYQALGEAGQAAGQKVGGDLGGILGSMLAPGVVPVLARAAQYGGMQLAAPALRRDENSPLPSGQIYDALERQGIQPTVGLVGNQTAARLEKSVSEVPFLGSALRTVSNAQKTQFDNAINRAGDAIQGDGPPVAPDVQSIGGTLQDAAGASATRRLNEFGQERSGIVADAGESLPVDVGGTLNRAAALRDKDGAVLAPGLNRVKGLLNADKIRKPEDTARALPEPEAPPPPPGDIRLTPQQAQELFRVFGNDLSKMDPAAIGGTPAAVERYSAPVGPTRPEVPLSRLLGTRDAVGRATSGERTLPKGAEKQVYGALTDDVKAAMDQVDPELSTRWTDFNQRYSTAMARELTSEGGDLRFMRDLGDRATMRPDEVQRLVFGNKSNPVPMQAVSQNAPKAYQGAASGQFLMEAGPTNGGRTGYSEFSPNTFLTNMSARETGGTLQPLVGDQAPRVFDLMDVAQAFRDAGRQENASGTAGTAFVQYALTNPAAVLANLPQGVLASIFTTGALTKPEFAQAVAGRSKGIVPYVDLPRGVRSGYAAGTGALADLYAGMP